MASKITFKPKQITKKILSDLHERAHDVVSKRFGLADDAERKTLEAIGEIYGITRERVRQIENAALTTIRKADAYKEEQAVFDELKEITDHPDRSSLPGASILKGRGFVFDDTKKKQTVEVGY